MKSSITLALFLDTRFPRKDEMYPVKVRVTYQRKQRYYPCSCELTKEQYKRVTGPKPSKSERAVLEYLLDKKTDIKNIINELPNFSFDLLKLKFDSSTKAIENEEQENATIESNVYNLFDIVIGQLEAQGRVGNADVMIRAKSSLQKFKRNLNFRDITVQFLDEYERWFLNQGKSITTVGIYLRELRNIYNTAISNEYNIVSREFYPFNNKDNPKGYKIPKGKNIKKALDKQQIKSIVDYALPLCSNADRARDFWYFTYLNNGINHKDICKLKYKDIYKDQIHFDRSKTIRSNRDKDRTVISTLLKESKRIIEKWGNEDKDPENYVFNILSKDLSARRACEVQGNHLHMINKYNKILAKNLKLGVTLTTMVARHSFASVMIENNVDIAILKELMGHSSIITTEIYVKPFNSKTRKKNALLLVNQ